MTAIAVVIPTTLAERLFAPEDRLRLSALGEVRWATACDRVDGGDAARLLAGCRVGIGSWGTVHPATPGLLAACPDLALWEHAAGSVKHMFTPEAIARKLTIASCKGAIADSVAELAVGELIIGLRGVLADAAGHRGAAHGALPSKPAQRTLAGARIGVVGASEVGVRVIRLLRAMGARVACCDPHLSAQRAVALGCARVDDLTALCAGCDAVTLHTPLLPSTRRLMGAAQFQAMADDAVFVNTSRGECVDEPALIAELERGRLHAFLDVTDPEPAAADSPLRRLPNAVLTSHIAGPASMTIGRQAVDDVAAFLAGGQPACIITPDMLERIA